MSQDDYKLWTGETVTFNDEDWERIVNVASSRLASFFCLDNLPEPLPDDLADLLANFICATLALRGNGTQQIESKSVRNFTIRFRTTDATNAFSQIANAYGDVIDKYSNCGSLFDTEKSIRSCSDGCF